MAYPRLKMIKMKKRMALRRKLLILRNLTNSKSVKKSSIIMDAFIHINNLKLKLEAMKRDLMAQQHLHEEVKVEKINGNDDDQEFAIRVVIMKSGKHNIMVSILEGFEEIGVNVIQAKVSCTNNNFFHMEAIVKAQSSLQVVLHVKDITQAIHSAITKTMQPVDHHHV
ncbi:uncharacterized protein LOC124929892 [Impatiens glandulifera]|uniref:uncharacterized protein LOC124929892 n=1 Tax=Impatiens glandulifera TaxID=253017 RepID=UPI001FB0DEC5|nr:uncharacterized protein LOC124929892 [Impatiens glandulifera]